jgi:flagellar hook-associated protein 2
MINPMRISGMVSGMDTEQMVKDLMKAHRVPLDKLFQKKQLEEWKRDSYRDINKLLLEFRSGKVFELRLERNFQQKVATSENDGAVSVKATGNPSLSNYTIQVESLAKVATPATTSYKPTLPDNKTAVGAGNGFTFEINGESFTVEETDTIDKIVNKVNAASLSTGVTATYFNGQLIFTSKTPGAGQTIDIQVNTGSGSVLGFDQPPNVIPGDDGDPGIVYINGVKQEITSNTFTYDGIEFTVKQSTAEALNVSVKTNEDEIFNTIKGFVDKYNEIIDKLTEKLTEKKYRDFPPLLDEQKKEMSEKQIELWEEKAKSGLLRQDPILSGILNKMRQSMSSIVSGLDGDFNSLRDIGITTAQGSAAYQDNGKLYIDEKKLREAIRNNGDKVMKIFTNTSAATGETKFNESGVAQRLYDQLDGVIKQISEKAGSTGVLSDNSIIGKSINNINDEIAKWEDRLKQIEDRYWRQFTAMENALQKLNAQSSWLAQQLGGAGQ